MLKRNNKASGQAQPAPQALKSGKIKTANQSEGQLASILNGYQPVLIESPMPAFYVKNLQSIADNVDYGVLKALAGTWGSYKSKHDATNSKLIGTGVHTTIMPSPGTNPGGIPGKYSFLCEEYIEKLTFDLVPGGVRNRGGNNEQFCGAVKYDQSIKSVNKSATSTQLVYNSIHEENGMFLWLSDVFNHAATEQSISEDRGIHPLDPNNPNVKSYPGQYQDVALYGVMVDGKIQYVTKDKLNGREYVEILPAKELLPGAGQTGPYFIPDYTISRSGVIPHGSTITILGDMVPDNAGNFLVKGAPKFPTGNATWNFAHLALSPTMGGAGTTPSTPINLDEPAPAWVHEELNWTNDPGENLIYTQRILAHPLYPYSVRPDMRVRDSINGENIVNHVKISLSSRKDVGPEGGILNIPFVNRFVPTVEMKMNMWLETVVEGGKEILQLQYEQIIFFEFQFGDNGGTTSWPHIQVNTLRKLEDLPEDQRNLIQTQFK